MQWMGEKEGKNLKSLNNHCNRKLKHSQLEALTYLDWAEACWRGLCEHAVYKDVLKVKGLGLITSQNHHYTIL